MYWTLGTALGILLHIVLFPASIAHIFPQVEKRERFLVDALRKPVGGLIASPAAATSGAAGTGERSFDSQPLEPAAS
jgi:hypothetical protein